MTILTSHDEAQPRHDWSPASASLSLRPVIYSQMTRIDLSRGTAETRVKPNRAQQGEVRLDPASALASALSILVDRELVVDSSRLLDSSTTYDPLPKSRGYPWLAVWMYLMDRVETSRDEVH